uniref:Uncharacterized protein AlNc14C197G8602 n=1 Tax=Albugo laibachii Nc14 TaxID=890382 RepID=F0WQC2_9STRA|nr:conserved hypothetical protein [Albugo laibachii Nc14]|eukprot:CCA23530.1 conserved hypothetical protein [Albugo laibachii Nc14]
MSPNKQSKPRKMNSTTSALNVEVELLVQATQSFASVAWQRKSGADRFHGWLWRKSGRIARWKNQHFILEGVLLSYFDKFAASQFVTDSPLVPLGGEALLTGTDDTTPSGVVRVAHVERSRKSKIAFKVYGVSGTVVDLRAKNEQVCNQWVERLLEAAQYAQRQETLNHSSTSTASSSIGYSDSELDLYSNLIDKSGWLEVNPILHKPAKKHYCVLQGTLITFYDSQDAWAVPVSRVYISGAEVNEAKREIVVETSEGRQPTRIVTLSPPTSRDFCSWKDSLRQALDN